MIFSSSAAFSFEHRSSEVNAVQRLAADFINDFKACATPDYERINSLCRLAFDSNPLLAQNASSAMFNGIIEPLCDDFSKAGVKICNEVLVHILDFVRHSPGGDHLDHLLTRCGFLSGYDILCRYAKIRQAVPIPQNRKKMVNKLLIISRVTAGADIAITSVMVHRLAKSFPQAEIVLLGPTHLETMFPELDNCRVIPFIYKNDSCLLDKMTSWPPLFEKVQEEQKGCRPGETMLFDPDTRMTQLGLLPLLADDSTCYFPSRAWTPRPGNLGNLSNLTNQWLNTILGENQEETPYLILHNEGHGYNAFCQKLKNRGCNFLIVLNFGVGNDSKKKISGPFEEKLLLKLAREPQTMLILDRGRGSIENARVDHLLSLANRQGINTGLLHEEQIPLAEIKFTNGLLAFTGSLDSLGKMICAADCFIGYDSCGQHLAAATGTPAAIIFAGAPSARFIERWSPVAADIITIIVDRQQTTSDEGQDRLVSQIKEAVAKIKKRLTRSLE